MSSAPQTQDRRLTLSLARTNTRERSQGLPRQLIFSFLRPSLRISVSLAVKPHSQSETQRFLSASHQRVAFAVSEACQRSPKYCVHHSRSAAFAIDKISIVLQDRNSTDTTYTFRRDFEESAQKTQEFQSENQFSNVATLFLCSELEINSLKMVFDSSE